MKAVYIEKFGVGWDLEVRSVPDPPPPIGSNVVVRVAAAGLNRADLLQTRGLYPLPAGYSPNIPGLEFAGVVEQVGSGAARYKGGERVFGITAGDAQSELVSVDESLLMPIPDSISFVEAGAVPEAFITAHDALFTIAGLGSGEALLIHAVGSGVGLAALQMAKIVRARIVGTSRTPGKLEKCRELGLDRAIVMSPETDLCIRVRVETGGKGVDAVLDLVGAAYFKQNLESLASRGRLVLVGLTSGALAEFDLSVALRKRLRITGTVLRPRSVEEKAEATRAFAKSMLPHFETGRIRPNLDRVFAAKDAVAAYKYLASNESFGKVVLQF